MRRPRLALAVLTFCGGLLATAAGAQDGGSPRVGECFGRTVRAPVYTREAHRVMLRPPHYEERVRPGVIGVETRRVLVRAAQVQRERIPALYRTLEHVETRPGRAYWVHTPAEYRFEQVRVLLEPAHSEWRRRAPGYAYQGAAPGQTIVEPTGEVLCRVYCPARYGTEERRVLMSPARSYQERGAPTYRRFVERALVRPARIVEHRIPALYRIERIQHVLRRPVRERYYVPGQVGTVVRERAHGGGPGWSRVYCPGPLNPAFVSHIQGSLNAQGYDAGPEDGRESERMHGALRRWQRDHHMAEGQVTVESARALGVAP